MRHHSATWSTRIDFHPERTGDRAGLLAIMDEAHFLSVGIERRNRERAAVVRLRKDASEPLAGEVLATAPLSGPGEVELRLTFDAGLANASVREAGGQWTAIGTMIDVEPLASVYAGLFTGLVVGPYAVACD